LDERLSQAQESYAAQDFLRAFALCKEVLDAQPDCVEALVLFGQLCLIAGEYLTAVQCLRLAEHIDPEHSGARALLVGDVANDGYREILKLDPSIANHTSAFVFSQIVPHAARLESMLREIIALRPDLAQAHASLGNLLWRMGRAKEGLDEYARALAIEPRDSAVRLGYAERLRVNGETQAAGEHLNRALQEVRIYREPASREPEMQLNALCAPDFWENNVMVELLIDREHTGLTKHYLISRIAPEATSSGPAFCCVIHPHDRDAIALAVAFAQESGRRVLNDPARLVRTSRTYLSEQPEIHPQLVVPKSVSINGTTLDVNGPPLNFPLLVRPGSSHRGQGLALVGDADQLRQYIAASAVPELVLTEYVEYASADGYYRKYRFIFVDGRPLPYHLAISPRWMVHYFSAPMEQHDWMRAEDAAFLAAPSEAFSGERWQALLALGEAIGLDYFGVDCALVDGKVLVFEANVDMLVHNFYEEELFSYKRPAFDAIAAAFNAMIRRYRSLP
jgi:tetratricopeptide (TPR) repeat protein